METVNHESSEPTIWMNRCINRLRDLAFKHGWNGVDNSKILETFFVNLLADKDEKLRRSDLAIQQKDAQIEKLTLEVEASRRVGMEARQLLYRDVWARLYLFPEEVLDSKDVDLPSWDTPGTPVNPNPAPLYGDKEILDMLADANEIESFGKQNINRIVSEIYEYSKGEAVEKNAYRAALRKAIVLNYAPKTETEANVSEC